MPDFHQRDTTPELMDTEAASFEDFRACLRELAQVNALTLAYRPVLKFFERLHRMGKLPAHRPTVVVDAGSGYGDLARRLDRWAAARGLPLSITGVDMNPWSARAASEISDPSRPLTWATANIFDFRQTGGVDVVVSSLFTHHLSYSPLVRFLTWMEREARVGWFVNDLQRHWLPYYALKAGFWVSRRHRFMRHDGPVSVASAFTIQEWRSILGEIGIAAGAARIERRLPFRLCVSRVKDAAP